MNIIRNAASALILGICFQSVAIAQQAVEWGSSSKPVRETIFGMKTYYEPERVQRDGDVVSFTLFRSADPATLDEVGRFKISCVTREFVSIVKDQATQPTKVLAGEELYPIGKKLCEWEKKGFMQNLLD